MLKKLIIFALTFAVIGCARKSEVTYDTPLYSDAELKTKTDIVVKKGTAVTAFNFRNHNTSWGPAKSIEIKTEKGNKGYIDARKLVIGQDPANSVFTWGYRKDYKRFYSAKDKRYKKGLEYSTLSSLPKKKFKLETLLKDTQLDTE